MICLIHNDNAGQCWDLIKLRVVHQIGQQAAALGVQQANNWMWVHDLAVIWMFSGRPSQVQILFLLPFKIIWEPLWRHLYFSWLIWLENQSNMSGAPELSDRLLPNMHPAPGQALSRVGPKQSWKLPTGRHRIQMITIYISPRFKGHIIR